MNAVKPTTRQLINRAALAILAAYALTTITSTAGLLIEPRTGCTFPPSWQFRR
jgi:hypothetical protein